MSHECHAFLRLAVRCFVLIIPKLSQKLRLSMARSKPAKTLKITVPRHNAQRIGPSLTAEIHANARQEGVLIQLPPPIQEQPSSAGPSAVCSSHCFVTFDSFYSYANSQENASEWNSLLISARAQRGPFWDIGTQQLVVQAFQTNTTQTTRRNHNQTQ